MTDIKALKEEIQKLELENKLKKLKPQTQKVSIPKEKDYSSQIKHEIKQLESQKLSNKGFRGFLRNANINYQINQRRQFVNAQTQTKKLTEQTKAIKSRVEFEKARNELNELKKKSSLNFEGIGGSSSGSRGIKVEDIFK